MKGYILTILLVIPHVIIAQREIAPIPRNISQVKNATLEALEDAEMEIPTGPIGINVEVDEEGQSKKVRIYTELPSAQKKVLIESFSQLEFFPTRKRGEAVSGRKDLTIILKPVSSPAEREVVQLDLDQLPPPPPFPGRSDDSDEEGLVDLLGGSYRFPPVIFRTELNDFPEDELDTQPMFLNLRVLKLQHQAEFPDRVRRPIMLNVLVENDGYVGEFEIKREQDRQFEIPQEWIDNMQFVPAMRNGTPVPVWVTVPFFVP